MARWLPGLILIFVACACAQPHAMDYSDMNNIPLQKVCVGRVQAELPGNGSASWSQSFDHSEVVRLPSVRNRDEFWAHVDARRRELETLPHDTEPSRLSRFERIGNHAAIILYREHEGSKRAHRMQRFLWLDGAGYRFQTGAMREHLTQDLTRFTTVFDMLMPRDNRQPSATPGFCVDAALLRGNAGRVSAGASVKVSGWSNVNVWLGAVEEPTDARSTGRRDAVSPDAELEREREAMAAVRREDPGAADDPVYPREFQVLRQEDRSLHGLHGREVVWRKVLNNGAVLYTFRWKSNGDGNRQPVASLGIDVGDRYKPEQTPPGEEELLALWDAMLVSLQQRPGAY